MNITLLYIKIFYEIFLSTILFCGNEDFFLKVSILSENKNINIFLCILFHLFGFSLACNINIMIGFFIYKISLKKNTLENKGIIFANFLYKNIELIFFFLIGFFPINSLLYVFLIFFGYSISLLNYNQLLNFNKEKFFIYNIFLIIGKLINILI